MKRVMADLSQTSKHAAHAHLHLPTIPFILCLTTAHNHRTLLQALQSPQEWFIGLHFAAA